MVKNTAMKTILIVDDEEDIRIILRMRLEKTYRVLEAASGRAALEVTKQKHPDLLVLDWKMPDLNGIDLLGALRQDPSTAHLPVIMTSGCSEESDRSACLAAGAFAYLVKPVNPKDLEDAIREALGQAE